MNNGTPPSRAHRWVTAAIGLLFAASAVAIVVVSDRSVGPLLAAGVVGALGVDAVVSALRNKRAMLSRIGPLP